MYPSVDLVEVLRVCVGGCFATQRYIAAELLKVQHLNSHGNGASTIIDLNEDERHELLQTLRDGVTVSVKSELGYRESSAAKDLVTTADILTQGVLVRLLEQSFAELPFTIVGEEEPVTDPTMLDCITTCIRDYFHQEPILFEAQLREHVARIGGSTITAATLEELRTRISVYVDPIDGTNCFIEGVWEVPMTLVGIALDGLPVAAVTNRVFCLPLAAASAAPPSPCIPCGRSVSYVVNLPLPPTSSEQQPPPQVPASPFLVFEGQCVNMSSVLTAPHATPTQHLRVVQSPTTKQSIINALSAKLEPRVDCFARGAGNKLFLLIAQQLAGSYTICSIPQLVAFTTSPKQPDGCDVFICPGKAIKKWDCCAPHAFLRALGGEIRDIDGHPLTYEVERKPPTSFAGTAEAFVLTQCELPNGVVAVTQASTAEVARRLHW